MQKYWETRGGERSRQVRQEGTGVWAGHAPGGAGPRARSVERRQVGEISSDVSQGWWMIVSKDIMIRVEIFILLYLTIYLHIYFLRFNFNKRFLNHCHCCFLFNNVLLFTPNYSFDFLYEYHQSSKCNEVINQFINLDFFKCEQFDNYMHFTNEIFSFKLP